RYGAPRYLHSFPTRRSSDLVHTARGAVPGFVECGTHVLPPFQFLFEARYPVRLGVGARRDPQNPLECACEPARIAPDRFAGGDRDRKSTRLNSSHLVISYAV